MESKTCRLPCSKGNAMTLGLRGLVAQLGERCVRNAEVVGSIPIRSTIKKGLPERVALFYL